MSASKNSTGETTSKRRKVIHNELEFSSSSLVQFKSKRSIVTTAEKKVLQTNVESEDSCSSPSSDQSPVSCYSSNRSVELDEESKIPVDLEVEVESAVVETSTCNYSRQRKKMSKSSELQTKIDELEERAKLESAVKPPPETNFLRRPIAKNRPTELQLEEFFVAAEKDIQKKFTDKYNYDIANDVPLEGRYKWTP